MRINVKFNDRILSLVVSDKSTLKDVVNLINGIVNFNIREVSYILKFGSCIIKSDIKLVDYGIKEGSLLMFNTSQSFKL